MVAQFNVLKNKDLLQNQTVSSGGGDYVPPAEGLAKLRLVAYVEVGKQRTTFNKVESFKPQVKLVFEIHGKKWEPKEFDGKKIPQRITITLNHSTSAKAGFYKLFTKMRDGRDDVTHMAELLGEAFMGRIRHREYEATVNGQKEKRIAAELTDTDKAWTITPPYVDVAVMEDGEPTGEFERRPQSVPEAISPLRLFIWDLADKEQWDSLFIEGADPEKQSFQLAVVKAKNFIGSPVEAVATGKEALLELASKGVSHASSEQGDSGDASDDDDGDQKQKSTEKKETKQKTELKKPDTPVAGGKGLDDID